MQCTRCKRNASTYEGLLLAAADGIASSCGSGTFSRTVSPRNSCSVSMVAGFSATTELSSLMASSTYRRLAAFLRSRMAVLKS